MSKLEVTAANASSLGAMLDTETVKELAEAGEIFIQRKNGSARMLIHLVTTYGASTINLFPRPGSKAKDEKSNVLTAIGPWGDEGKQADWYDLYFEGCSLGKKLANDYKRHIDGKATHPNEADWEAEKTALAARKGQAVSRIKEAIKLNHMLERLNADTECFATITLNGGSVVPSNKCIFLRDQAMTKFKQWSIGQVLAIDIDWAMDQPGGATFENVIKSIKRGAGTTKPKIVVSKVEEFDDAIAAVTGYLTKIREAGNEKEYKGFVSHLNQAGSDYLLLAMDDLYTKIENYTEMPSNKDRLIKLQEAGGMPALLKARKAAA